MLVIKCPQCSRSYRLAESLYRRKAAGFGVVITCRHCKTQIHVDEGALPPVDEGAAPGPMGDAFDMSTETDVPSDPNASAPDSAPPSSGEQAMPLVVRAIAEPGMPIIAELDAPTLPPAAEIEAATLPPVAPRAVEAPRAAGIPRPAAVPRPSGSATGTPMPVRAATGTTLGLGRPIPAPTPTPNDAALTPTPGSKTAAEKPKIIALSPGLLGVKTAPKNPTPSPSATAAKASPESENVPNSIPDAELFAVDSEPPVSKPPDSAMPIDSVDYLESVRPVAPPLPKGYAHDALRGADPDATPVPKARDKRLPHAPPARHLPSTATAGEPKEGDVPSATGTPKMAELAHGSSPLALNQKKGAPKRKRQPSGDLTDDFLSTDVSFDSPPALAPPDAAALLRAPVSSRPSAASMRGSVEPSAQGSKAPVSRTTGVAAEKKGGRGFLYLLIAAAFGSAGYFWTHRVPVPSEPPQSDPNAAISAAVTTEPPAPPVAEPPSATATETTSGAPEPTAAPLASTATSAAATTPLSERPSKPHAETTTASVTKIRDDEPATETRDPKTPAAPTPTNTAVIEPRGPVGTDPFDVAAARSALEATAAQASSCRKSGDPSGVAVVTLTFSQTGRVTTATISGPPFQATPTGGCIASTLRKTRVPAFAGDMVTVRKTVTIE
jgi:ribonuclease E